MNDEAKFDHYPLIEGASVPLRRHIADPMGSDRLEFSVSNGKGQVDDVKFDVLATVGCNVEVSFKPEGAQFGAYRYYVDVEEVVGAAYEQFKKDRGQDK